MDIKRLLLALALSFVFIVTWNVFFPPIEEEIEKREPSANTEERAEKEQDEEQEAPTINNVTPGKPP